MSLGIGAMLHALSSNKETVDAISGSFGKTISGILIEDNRIKITFADLSKIEIWDDGQSCCESRYVSTSDTLPGFVGAVFTNAVLKSGPTTSGEYGYEHEIQFLELSTSLGPITFENHNEHNGYYGGFGVCARRVE